jgi:hypothetical protein
MAIRRSKCRESNSTSSDWLRQADAYDVIGSFPKAVVRAQVECRLIEYLSAGFLRQQLLDFPPQLGISVLKDPVPAIAGKVEQILDLRRVMWAVHQACRCVVGRLYPESGKIEVQRWIRRIDFWYNTKGLLMGKANVTVFGLK